MNGTVEQKLEHLARQDKLVMPDFEIMWSRIETRGKPKVKGSSQPHLQRKKVIYSTAIATCLIVAVPVIASSTDWNWIRLYNPGFTSALDQGFGQTIEKSVTDRGLTFTLHQAVTDQNRLMLDYSMPVDGNKSFDSAFFTSIKLLDSKSKEIKGNQINKRDETSGNLVGYFQADAPQTTQLSKMKLVAEGVNFVKQIEHPLAFDAVKTGGQEEECGCDGIDKVKITSISYKAIQIVIDYRVLLNDENATYIAPSLKLSVGGHNITTMGATVLPSNNLKEIIVQARYQAEGVDRQEIHFDLAYNKLVDRIDGKWAVSLTLDAEKTKHASYAMKLNGEEIPAANQMYKLEELVVTPTQIRINAKSLGFDNSWSQLTTYSNIQLKIGDKLQLLNGGVFAENDGISFRFDAPLGKNLASQSMTLIMSDAIIESKSPKSAQFKLNNPNTDKQKVEFPVGGIPVEFTYYRQEQDLILESTSTDPAFGGMVQSLILNGTIYSDSRQNEDPSRRANWQTEIFHDVHEGDITVTPWLYTIIDHTKRLEIKIK